MAKYYITPKKEKVIAVTLFYEDKVPCRFQLIRLMVQDKRIFPSNQVCRFYPYPMKSNSVFLIHIPDELTSKTLFLCFYPISARCHALLVCPESIRPTIERNDPNYCSMTKIKLILKYLSSII